MIKVNKGMVEIAGTAEILAAEVAGLLRHLFTSMAEHDKIAGAAAFNCAGKAMADAAEDLVENFGIDLESLNIHNEMDDDDDLKEIFGHFEGETKSDADGELDEDDDAPDPGVVFLHRKKDSKK